MSYTGTLPEAEAQGCSLAPGAAVRRRSVAAIFSFPAALSSLLAFLVFLTVRSRINDPDTWWELRLGQTIWNTRHIPSVDLFSYTTQQHAWTPHEWLTQLSVYGMYRWAGYQGLMLWMLALSILLVVGGYWLCVLYSGNPKTAFAGALAIWICATSGLAARPQVLGYVLLVCELLLLELGRVRSRRWLWGLPFLFALWVNIHPSFSMGVVVLFVTVACSRVSGRWGLIGSEAWPRARQRALLTVAALSTAALALNPSGWRQLVYPVDVLFHQSATVQFIDEWLPLPVFSPRGLALLTIVAAVVSIPLLRRVELRLSEVGLVVLGALFALQHRRMVFAFGILAAPVLARLLARLWDSYEEDADKPLVNAAVMAAVLLAIVWMFPREASLRAQVRAGNPAGAVEFVREQHLSGPMLNDFGFGGYLMWAMPEHPVFIDGRADVYAWSGVFDQMARWEHLQEDPNLLLDRYGVRFCVLRAGSPMARVVRLLPGWQQVYGDAEAVVLVRRS